jgi:hypothetical protein
MVDNFFDKNLFQQIFAGIVILLIAGFFSGKQIEKETVSSSKKWKIVVILGWILIIGGALFTINSFNGGIYNPYIFTGIGLAFLGLVLNWIGKFFIWLA